MPLRLPPSSMIVPLGDTLFCQMFAQTSKWKEGSKLILPDTAREEVFVARVLSVGPGKAIEYDEEGRKRIRMPPEIEPSTLIVFSRYHGERFEIDGSYYLILREDDVLAELQIPSEKIDEYLRVWTIGMSDGDLLDARIK